MPKLKSDTIIPTGKENNIITEQAYSDDTVLTDQQLAEMKPILEFPELQALVKRGRPHKLNPKQSTTIRLDAEVLGFFKQHGKGWQTEINDILRDYVQEHRT
ncbi:MAG: BrnA antitoxin family protein [Thermodesulfobacteriota bacterium]|nr:BrnA antitoxin family protein [Thermodesulfobacteriota bacterium]